MVLMPLDPVTFQPRQEGDAPVVTLGLEYDPTPARGDGFMRAGLGVPAWLLLLGVAFAVANYAGGRI